MQASAVRTLACAEFRKSHTRPECCCYCFLVFDQLACINIFLLYIIAAHGPASQACVNELIDRALAGTAGGQPDSKSTSKLAVALAVPLAVLALLVVGVVLMLGHRRRQRRQQLDLEKPPQLEQEQLEDPDVHKPAPVTGGKSTPGSKAKSDTVAGLLTGPG